MSILTSLSTFIYTLFIYLYSYSLERRRLGELPLDFHHLSSTILQGVVGQSNQFGSTTSNNSYSFFIRTFDVHREVLVKISQEYLFAWYSLEAKQKVVHLIAMDSSILETLKAHIESSLQKNETTV